MKEIKDFAACAGKQHYLSTCFLKHSHKKYLKVEYQTFP